MKRIFLCAILSGGLVSVGKNEVMAQSQMNRGAYFLEGISVRHELNPAWMSEKDMSVCPDWGICRSALREQPESVISCL